MKKHLFWIVPVLGVLGIVVFMIFIVWLTETRPCIPTTCRATWAGDCRCTHPEHRMEWRGELMLCTCKEKL